jgi:hypothetical protein
MLADVRDNTNEASAFSSKRIPSPIAEVNLMPVGQDMLQRVRKTAKWSQLYQTGASFPPKHKVLFIN